MFKKASRKKAKLKMGVSGPSGGGKTYSANRLARGLVGPEGKIALIDTENGSASLYSDRFNFDVLEIQPPFEHRKFIEGIEAAIQGGYDAVIIDSASHFWEGILEYKDKLDRRGGSSFSNWNEAGRHFKDIINAVLQSPIHVICCLRSKVDYVVEQDGKGKATPKKVGLAPIMREGIEYEFTTVFDLDLSHNAAVSKDRTGLFADRIFQITEETGEQLARWLDEVPAPEKPTVSAPVEPKPAPPAPTVPDEEPVPGKVTGQQLENIQNLWSQLQYGPEQMSKLFAWLGIDDLEGGEKWEDLTQAQAAKTIGFLSSKLQKGGAQ